MKILGVAVVVVLLAGCTAVPRVEPVETPASQIDLVKVDQPAQVFDGDCSAMFSDAAVSEALGQQLTQLSDELAAQFSAGQLLDPESVLVEQAGGVQCMWGDQTDSSFSAVLLVAAVPATAVSAAEEVECVPTDISATGCPIDVTANGIRLSGLVTSDVEGASGPSRVAAVEALFVSNAAAVAAPAPQVSLDGEWQTPIDCAAIAASVDWAALGEAEPLQSDDSMGTDAYSSAVENDLRSGRRVYPCILYAPGSAGVSFSVLGGGAWNRDAVLAQDGAQVVDVSGFDLVVETDGGTIDIFDGVNWLHSSGDAALYPALTAIVEVLDAAAD